MKIKAIIDSPTENSFTYSDVEIDAPKPDEILVKIEAVGLCHTDILARQGLYQLGGDAVLGHEGAGIVEDIGGDVTKVKVGDRVGISFRSCGTCPKCEAQLAVYCREFIPLNIMGSRLDGSSTLKHGKQELRSNFFGQSSFASHALTYESNVVVLPDDPYHIRVNDWAEVANFFA